MEKNAPVWTLTRDTFCNGFQVQRIKARGYSMWIDIEKRQGSTAEGMADAEGAAVMCYGISQAYKESSNCRLEAQYAYQQQLDMVPLMMQEGYSAKGWLGMLLGATQELRNNLYV